MHEGGVRQGGGGTIERKEPGEEWEGGVLPVEGWQHGGTLFSPVKGGSKEHGTVVGLPLKGGSQAGPVVGARCAGGRCDDR